MIRFYCEHCAHKISVRDNDVGKQGKCQKCGDVIVVPTESTIIDFLCEYCDRNISVPKSHAGKKVICPKCSNTFIIPTTQFPASAASQSYSGDMIARTTDSSHGLTLMDDPEEYKLKEEPAFESSLSEETIKQQKESEADLAAEEIESSDQSKLPRLIDTFLYPISTSGIIHLAFYVIVPLLISGFIGLIEYFLEPHLGLATAEITEPADLILNGIFYSYMCYYIADCVISSSKGNRRAAEVSIPNTISIGDFISQAVLLIGCTAICLAPVLLYSVLVKRTDLWFWALAAYGTFFLPMSLLRGIMFDAFDALNPIEIVRSICRALLPYCGLVLFFLVVGGFIAEVIPRLPFWEFLKQTLKVYLVFVLAHRLGWFYWWYKDKLGWGL